MRETKAVWRRRVTSFRASGKTAAEFAAEHGLVEGTLRWWSSQFNREVSVAPAAPLVRLAHVIRSPAPPTARGSVIVDVLDARARVTVEAGVARETLDAVFGALGIGAAR